MTDGMPYFSISVAFKYASVLIDVDESVIQAAIALDGSLLTLTTSQSLHNVGSWNQTDDDVMR